MRYSHFITHYSDKLSGMERAGAGHAAVVSSISFLSAWLLTGLLYQVPGNSSLAIRLKAQKHELFGESIQAGGPILYGILLAFGAISWDPALGREFWSFFLGATLIMGLGLVDDMKALKPLPKLIYQALIAASVIALNPEWSRPFQAFGIVNSPTLSHVLCGLWLVGVMNAMNLIDGINGLCSGIGALSGATLAILLFQQSPNAQLVGTLSLAFAAGCLGFFFHNYFKGKIFLGDSGSLLTGYLLSLARLKVAPSGLLPQTGIVVTAFVGVPVLDMLWVMGLRLRAGESIFKGDRRHLHHRLLRIGLSQRQAAGAILMYTALVNLVIAIALSNHVASTVAIFLFAATMTVAAFLVIDAVLRGRLPQEQSNTNRISTAVHRMIIIDAKAYASRGLGSSFWLFRKVEALLKNGDTVSKSAQGRIEIRIFSGSSTEKELLAFLSAYQFEIGILSSRSQPPVGVQCLSAPDEGSKRLAG